MARTRASGANFKDRTGQRFGRWTVLRRTSQIKKVRWICRCDCGTIRDVSASDLQSGHTNSCGCLIKDRAAHNLRGVVHRREYQSWSGMKQRCYYAGHNEFHRYGGRGIVVCNEWRTSFETFLRDMGPCPIGSSLDRINTDGPYSPSNCRWATRQEQMSHTSRNVYIDYEGQTFTLKQLAAHLNVSYFSLHAYVRRRGLSLAEAIARAEASPSTKRHRKDST